MQKFDIWITKNRSEGKNFFRLGTKSRMVQKLLATFGLMIITDYF